MNHSKYLFACLLLASLSSNAIANPRFSCNTLDLMNADPLVEDMIDRILVIAKVQQKYHVCRLPHSSNAAATIYKNKRLIAYDPKFISQLAAQVHEMHWGKVTILAHEIGHHKFQHTDRLKKISQLNQTQRYAKYRQFELEADQFAGNVLANMGASLENSQAVVTALDMHVDDSALTHPSGEKRIAAVTKGWNKGCQQAGSECNGATRSPRSHQAKIIRSPLGSKATPHYTRFMQQAEKYKGGHITAAYCKSYATIAVHQAKRSQQYRCRFNVDTAYGQWSTKYVPQYDWCMQASAYATSKETKFREGKLASCVR